MVSETELDVVKSAFALAAAREAYNYALKKHGLPSEDLIGEELEEVARRSFDTAGRIVDDTIDELRATGQIRCR